MAGIRRDAVERHADSSPKDSRRMSLGWQDVLLGFAVVLLVVFPVAARLSANDEPVHTALPAPRLPPLTRGHSEAVKALPRFSPTGATFARVDGIAQVHLRFVALARTLVGGQGAQTLWRLVSGHSAPDLGGSAELLASGEPAYPFRYPQLEPVLRRLPPQPSSRQVADENDLAVLLMLGAAGGPASGAIVTPVPNAASAAFALLDRARRSGACIPQENIALLLASDAVPWDAAVEREFQRAEQTCPNDPTPVWLEGEYESQRAAVGQIFDPGRGSPESLDYRLARTFATFRRLQTKFPRLAASWSGQADAEMRIGYQLESVEPFTARQRFHLALALYRRAQLLDSGPDVLMGVARALAALGDTPKAIAVQRRATAKATQAVPFQAELIDYLQRAHQFSGAAQAASVLATESRLSSTTVHGLFPQVSVAPEFETPGLAIAEDLNRPLSSGADELKPIRFVVGPGPGGAGATVSDLSFLPVYRPAPGLGGESRWCPDWSRRLDLLLSGQPRAASLQGSAVSSDVRDGSTCWWAGLSPSAEGPDEILGVAELELGNVKAAQGVAEKMSSNVNALEDLRQNVWRYSGNFQRAAAAAQQWATRFPGDALARIRQGEIALLAHRYEDAVLDFQTAVRIARRQALWSRNEAEALLDEGAAFEREGRRSDALSAFAAADQTASEWFAGFSAKAESSGTDITWPAYISYNATEQTGDAELEMHDYRRATEAYQAAADYEKDLTEDPPVIRPEVLANNRAIAELLDGAPAVAAGLASQAVAHDPANPIFHSTEAWALQRTGRWDSAVRDYREAVALDPTEYPAQNDLGVLLMQHHLYGAAAAALRRAVGANPRYAKGWFNLGVALSHLGPLHLVAAEGSLGRAAMLDSSLGHRPPTPILDNVPYVTHLDLSKPLSEHWTFADSQIHTPIAAAGFSVVLLLTLSLARSLLPRAAPGGAERWLAVLRPWSERTRKMTILRSPLVAIAMTLGVFLWPLRDGSTAGWLPVVTFAVGLLILASVAVRVRMIVANRGGLKVNQESWIPGVAFAVGTTVAGLGWAPLPVLHTANEPSETAERSADAASPRAATADVTATTDVENLHWAAPVALGAIALVELLLAALLNVPLTRSLGAASLVMTASLLTPIKPIDGGTVSQTTAGTLSTLAAAGMALLVLLGVL